ncbi:hypothetical protein SAMN04487968_11167 [Nocardioides terrae]|uniref:Uncharacterized protein n=1 Tax=Nocardioides terrae TaxID=574651 RepID=A0A1I1LXY0_9ACTN|nr:hypothetical protein [Nocardioides terrae]SFC77979.1 hypothetical protein SAMN04487968_11167 [Nocardioides terrae]
MTALTITLACVAVIAAAVAVLALAALRRAHGDAAREATGLRMRLDALEAGLMGPEPTAVARPAQEYVITHLGEPEPDADEASVPVRLAPPAFADAVLRETVVQAASLVQGVRRALAPETRHRIRFEMRREVKRSRKARKVEVKEALRAYRAGQRETEGAA